MSALPPHILADVDQHRALLVELVGAVREHVDAEACLYPEACPGYQVALVLRHMDGLTQARLLVLALHELRARGYDLPVHLTEVAVVALNDKPKRRWWSWRR
ncbi:hypothetical protein OOJ91_13905 [Micromonospora lupini]|uniref:hypothetical protein n=1 Tax=Micromonospora lupini TaxID=285679 RepID=UPI002258774E|nr:hypothetical protein [Micromonospora lupini]MCX5066942.1 hypothetical protein [Micromonospora lupini]